jgi:hypothetical protein
MAATLDDFDQPTWMDIVFRGFREGSRDTLHDRFLWDPLDPRTAVETRSYWSVRPPSEPDDAPAAA